MADIKTNPITGHEQNEKAVASSDVESSQISHPIDDDELPDPDVGKTPEERAALVRPPILIISLAQPTC